MYIVTGCCCGNVYTGVRVGSVVGAAPDGVVTVTASVPLLSAAAVLPPDVAQQPHEDTSSLTVTQVKSNTKDHAPLEYTIALDGFSSGAFDVVVTTALVGDVDVKCSRVVRVVLTAPAVVGDVVVTVSTAAKSGRKGNRKLSTASTTRPDIRAGLVPLSVEPLNETHHVVLSFSVASSIKDVNTKLTDVHQVFLRLEHELSGREIYFVARPAGGSDNRTDEAPKNDDDGTSTYSAEIAFTDDETRMKFEHDPGVYKCELIVADSSIDTGANVLFACCWSVVLLYILCVANVVREYFLVHIACYRSMISNIFLYF